MSLWRIHIPRIFLIWLGFWMLSSFFFAAPVHAFVDPITVTSQTDTISFPKGIDFQMNASDADAPITQATIVIMFKIQGSEEQHDATITQPAPHLMVHWHEDTTGDNFAPPGTQITYYWKLQDNAGNTHTDQPQKFFVTDTRFNWQDASDGLLQVHWYSNTADFGQTVLQDASTNLKQISGNLGGGLHQPINLWVYQTIEDFRGSLSPQTHEWVGGVAFPALNQASIVAVASDDDTLIRDMPHELTHLVFHQLIRGGILAPTWFDEGLAVYNQMYHEPPMTQRLKQALASHTLLPLNDLSYGFPADADKAYLAYAQSWNLVDYMYRTFGQARMAVLIKDMNSSRTSFEQDMTDALGLDPRHLENQWHLSLNQPATLTPDQLASGTRSQQDPLSVRVATDKNAPFLLLLGILLVVLPPLGFGGLLFYQRRNHENVALGRQAQAAFNASLYARPVNPRGPSTDPARYSSLSVSQQTPWSYPSGENAKLPQTPWPSNSSTYRWGSTPPATGEGNNQANGGQEFWNQPPKKQPPWE